MENKKTPGRTVAASAQALTLLNDSITQKVGERYKIGEIDNERFYLLPKSLFSNEIYSKLSITAKVIYAVLRDRMILSAQNRWKDANNDIYLLFKQEDIQNILRISHPTCTKAMKQLEEIHLIDIIRQGMQKPNKIYIRKPLSNISTNFDNSIEKDGLHQEVKKFNIGSKDFLLHEVKKVNSNDTEYNDTEKNDTERSFSSSYSCSSVRSDSDIVKVFEELKKSKANTAELEKLDELSSQYSKHLLLHALKETSLRQKKSLKYTEGILKNWKNANTDEPWQLSSVPTLAQILDYCNSENIHIDVRAFVDYYAMTGWTNKNGKKVVDWKAAVNNWKRNEERQQQREQKHYKTREERQQEDDIQLMNQLEGLERGMNERKQRQEIIQTEREKKYQRDWEAQFGDLYD